MAANIPSEVGVEGAIVGAHLLSRPAEEFGNDPNVETAWAIKAIEHMEVYFNLLRSVDPKLLRLTPHDDEIFKEFREIFPDFPVSVLCEDKIKSEESKTKWRPFCQKFASIVEDYNFGTLVRIDSSDEYSEKNSILVPRIQFLAIEIARNREGCNDEIRTKFKPAAPRAKEPTQCVNICWKTKIIRHIEEAFDSLCYQYNLSPVAVKQGIRKGSGSQHKGDFSVFLGSPHMKQFLPYINEIVHRVTSEKSGSRYFLDCTISPDHLIQLTLDRPSIFRGVISEVTKMKSLYGSSASGQGLSVLIAVCNSNEFSDKSLVYLRNEVIAQHLASVLQYSGFQVFLATDAASERKQIEIPPVNIEHINCSAACNTGNLCQALLKQAKDSKWRKDPDEMRHSRKAAHDMSTMNSYDEIILDSREYLAEKSRFSNYKTYFKRMDNIYVQANDLTEIFKRAVHLEHVVGDHMALTPEWIIHIGPEYNAHLMQSSGLLLEMLTEKKSSVQQIYITHVSGSSKNQPESDADCILGKIKHQMETALIHKYGPEVLNEQTWISCINILTETAFKFDLLANPSCPPKIVHGQEDKSKTQERKRGTFVQYNCARLSRLFKRHEELVNEGRYSKLPQIEEVDFNLLKLQEEWNLLFNFVLPFPSLIKSIHEDLWQSRTAKAHCPSHEVCRMLMALSQELSLYYNRTRVLVESVPHLQRTMAARIWLLRAVHQVMKNALSLLGIEALEKM